MASYSVQTELDPEQAIEKAVAYFGEDGLGLNVIEHDDCCARFQGSGGFVDVRAGVKEAKTTVRLETREWDIGVRNFMGQIKD